MQTSGVRDGYFDDLVAVQIYEPDAFFLTHPDVSAFAEGSKRVVSGRPLSDRNVLYAVRSKIMNDPSDHLGMRSHIRASLLKVGSQIEFHEDAGQIVEGGCTQRSKTLGGALAGVFPLGDRYFRPIS